MPRGFPGVFAALAEASQRPAGFKGSEDVVRNNIVFGPYRPIRVAQPWGSECDFNLRHVPGTAAVKPATELQKQSGPLPVGESPM